MADTPHQTTAARREADGAEAMRAAVIALIQHFKRDFDQAWRTQLINEVRAVGRADKRKIGG